MECGGGVGTVSGVMIHASEQSHGIAFVGSLSINILYGWKGNKENFDG